MYEYLDDGVTSDVTFEARAGTLVDLFREAADATTNVMVESLDSIRPSATHALVADAESLDLLLARFLDELIFAKDAHGRLLRATHVEVEKTERGFRVDASFAGEEIDAERHRLASDVKAVTLHGLAVTKDGGLWHARVTLDV